jgi:predicted cupin superfamily sugar epimerase
MIYGPPIEGAMSAEEVVRLLGLTRHPEGGFYGETWRDQPAAGGRGSGTAIYYLLPQGEISAWHRVDAAEIWHWYGGAALKLRISADGETVAVHRLGNRLRDGEQPQILVPPDAWQSAESLGPWTLVGCTVSPAFEFRHFELAPSGWEPAKR